MNCEWIDINKEKPKPKQRVYVICEYINHNGKIVHFQTMAEYIPYMTLKEEDYMHEDWAGEGDYNEEEDVYYTPEGFYEWQSSADINYLLSTKVVYWMPLFKII